MKAIAGCAREGFGDTRAHRLGGASGPLEGRIMTRPEGMLQIFAPMGSIALYVMSERFVPERLDCLVGIQVRW